MADYFQVDPTIMRLLWVLLAIFTGGVAIVAYVVMAVVVPVAPAPAPGIEPGAVGGGDESAGAGEAPDQDDEPEGGEGAPQRQSEPTAPDSARTYQPYASGRPDAGRSSAMRGAAFVGLALIVIGILALLDSLGFFAQFDSWRLWPLILIAFGAIPRLEAPLRAGHPASTARAPLDLELSLRIHLERRPACARQDAQRDLAHLPDVGLLPRDELAPGGASSLQAGRAGSAARAPESAAPRRRQDAAGRPGRRPAAPPTSG